MKFISNFYLLIQKQTLPVEVLIQICKVLNESADYLLGLEDLK